MGTGVSRVPKPETAVLLEPTPGVTSFRVTAAISPANGDVIVHGQDQTTGSVTHFAASEYEWFLTIPAEEKDRLLLELLRSLANGDVRVRETLSAWLKQRGLTFEEMAF